MEFANVVESGYDAAEDAGCKEADPTGPPPQNRQMDQTPKPEQTASGIPPLSWVLSVPRGVRAELRLIGKEITKGDLERLKQQIDFLVASFEDGQASS